MTLIAIGQELMGTLVMPAKQIKCTLYPQGDGWEQKQL
jgi:hypothetical protein